MTREFNIASTKKNSVPLKFGFTPDTVFVSSFARHQRQIKWRWFSDKHQ